MIVDRFALALRRLILRTARSPLRALWALVYAAIARLAARVLAPSGSGTDVYLGGSLASGEPVYGISDIDLIAVAPDEDKARDARRRFEDLCRTLPPLRRLLGDFCAYERRDLARVLAGPYPMSADAVFVGPDVPRDEKELLERPGLWGRPEWRRLRGSRGAPPVADHGWLLPAWLELQYRWRWAFYVCAAERDVERPAVALVAEAARIWLWLEHGERHDGRRAPMKRALALLEAEREGLTHALEVHRDVHRAPAVDVEVLLGCFVSISQAVAAAVEGAAVATGHTRVELVGVRHGNGVPLLDWRALALPELDWSTPERPRVVEERLALGHGDPADRSALLAAAASDVRGRVSALRRGPLLVEPPHDLWGRGRLRTVQGRFSDPVSIALLDGHTHADFPAVPGWSARDWARRAVAEHRAWLRGGRSTGQRWTGSRPPAVSSSPATLGLLLSAARSALFLESVDAGQPRLPLTFADLPGADAAEACAALDERRSPPPELVGHFRRQVESLYGLGRPARPVARPPQARNGDSVQTRRGANVTHWLSQTWWMTEEERSRSFNPDDAQRIRELGLDHIRLPLDERWLWHADGRRDDGGFEVLFETLEWCREAELAAIVSGALPVDRWLDLSATRARGVAYQPLGEPEDAVPGPIVRGFAYYEPMPLTHYRVSWRPDLGPIRDYDRKRIGRDLDRRASTATYCSEFGVSKAVPDEPRLRWYRDVIDSLEEREMAWSIWELRGQFGLYDGDRPTVAMRAIEERRFAA